MKILLFLVLFIASFLIAPKAYASCINITSPANSSSVVMGSSVTVKFTDTCSTRWFECLYVDGAGYACATPNPQQFVWNTGSFGSGSHTLMVKSWSKNQINMLGSSQITVNLGPISTPVPTSTSTPVPSICLKITSPSVGQIVAGAKVPVLTDDTCTGAWYESFFLDGAWVNDFNVGTIVFDSTKLANGNHLIEVTSQSANPGSTILSKTSESITVNNGTPTPTPTPAPVTCIQITSPTGGQAVTGTVNVKTADTCTGVWYESLYLDGTYITDFPVGSVLFNAGSLALGTHTVKVTAQSTNPGSITLGSSTVTVSVTDTTPGTPTPATPTPSSTPTPLPAGHFSTLAPNVALPSASSCAMAISSSPIPEHASWNVDDGSPAHWDSNHQSFTTPSYYYQNAGSQIWTPNLDLQNVDGNFQGSTDDIIRWAACKWGVDENWARAQSEQESGWHQDCAAMHGGSGCHENGDNGNYDGTCTGLPANINAFGYSVTNNSGQYNFASAFGLGAWNSWGVIQSKTGCAEWQAQPLISLSTAWGEDYRWAKFHSCMTGGGENHFGADNTKAVTKATSAPNALASGSGFTGPTNLLSSETNLQYLALGCIGTHFSGGWYDSGAVSYDQSIVGHINNHDWPGGVH